MPSQKPPTPRFEDHAKHIEALMKAALAAVEPGQAVRGNLTCEGSMVRAGESEFTLGPDSRVFIVGAGKAGVAMAHAALEIMGDRFFEGVMSVPRVPEAESGGLHWFQGGHPLPSPGSVEPGAAMKNLLAETSRQDLVLALISGGGSALLELPAADLTLEALQDTTGALLRSGARIDEVNTVRQQLSLIKGGGLAAMAAPARVVALILSDVVGDPIEFIASGPTVVCSGDASKALAVLDRYGLKNQVPAAVLRHLQRWQSVPRPSATADLNLIIGSNRLAGEAARAQAEFQGFNTSMLTNFLQGEAREVGRVVAGLAKQMARYGEPIAAPACVILGGETTVTVRGEGVGGRNQELALAAALALDRLEQAVIASFGTDGIDGPTPAAGAVVNGETCDLAQEQGWNPEAALANNDSHSLLAAIGADLYTGPTGTNVNDLTFVLCYPM